MERVTIDGILTSTMWADLRGTNCKEEENYRLKTTFTKANSKTTKKKASDNTLIKKKSLNTLENSSITSLSVREESLTKTRLFLVESLTDSRTEKEPYICPQARLSRLAQKNKLPPI